MEQLASTLTIPLTGSMLTLMGSASRYWRLIRLDGTGQRRDEAVEALKTFFWQQFPELLQQADVPDALVQRKLLEVMQFAPANQASDFAERCLRCYISHQIEQTCIQLETRFGNTHGFTRYDLLPLVLDDDGQPKLQLQPEQIQPVPQYRSLATEILQTFDHNRASLSTWTARLVRQQPELSRFLRERGVFLISDWALLSNTQPGQLQRILSQFYALTPVEIEHACQLLQSYHDVYRAERLHQRQVGKIKGKVACRAPTPEQLTRIGAIFQAKTACSLNSSQEVALTNDRILSKLQFIATQLRQYRLHQQGGNTLITDSLDRPENQARVAELPTAEANSEPDEQLEFLQSYRHQFLIYLDQALEKATSDRLSYLKRKNAQTAEHFIRALHLFHCQGKSMGEIASYVGLSAQFQVTRLMKLKEFRAVVRQYLLQLLLEHVLEKAKVYADPNRLQTYNQTIETALSEQVSAVLTQAENEAAIAKRQPLTSLFSRRLCRYLDTQLNAFNLV